MSPTTNGKPKGSLTKRKASSTPGSAKKRAKKAVNSNAKAKRTGSTYQHSLEYPDGWDNMSLYKSFLLSNERFELNDTIFVNSQEQPEDNLKDEEDSPNKTIDETDNTLWVAAVVEVRAQSPWNVWAKVEWFYRPDELPVGRQPYHGKREVIKSPVQDIISAHTVAGHADVTHWEEMDDSQDADGIDGLFWRQTYDPATNKLSEIRLHCVCQKPYNPDTTMFWCDKCKLWEHEKCLVNGIKKQLGKILSAATDSGLDGRLNAKNVNITLAADSSTGEVTANIAEKHVAVKAEPVKSEVVDTKVEDNLRSDANINVPVKCLKCGAPLK